MNLPLELRGLIRSLRRDPAFLAASVLTLGLGIGAGSAVFSLVKAVVLTPLPWSDPDSLVLLWNRPPVGSALGVSAPELSALRLADPLESVAAFMPGGANLVLDGRARQLWVTTISPGTFRTLGVQPILGRDFVPEDHEQPSSVILGHELWRDSFGSDREVVGRRIRFDGAEHEVVGVLPPGVAMPTDYRWAGHTEIWSPMPRKLLDDPDTDARRLWVVARLRAGTSPAAAAPALEAAHRRLQSATPAAYPGGTWRLESVPVEEEVLGSSRRTLGMLSAAVAIVLAVAGSNLSLLLAARGLGRRRELSIRAALGASSRGLAASGILEAVVVALLGAGVGVGIAWATVAVVPALAPGAFPRSDRVTLDGGVVVFAVGLSLLVALASAAREAWRRRRAHPWEALGSGRGAAETRSGARRALLGLEVALSTVLVAGAALLLQSLGNLRRAPLGFDPHGVVTGDIVLPEERYRSPEQIVAYFEPVLEAAKALPGVDEAGWTTTVPFWNPAGTTDVEVEGIAPRQGPAPLVAFESISPGLLGAVGTPLLRGRDLAASDREGAPLVALVNRAFQERFWPGDSALGHRVRLTGGGTRPWVTIVGVFEDARDQAIVIAPRPRISIPYRQLPETAGRPSRYLSIMVRTGGDASALVRPLRAVVATADPEIPLGAARTLASEVHSASGRPRLASRLTGAFAAAALALVLAGLYGLLASSVARRSREIGIRVALGAPRRSVVGLVLREGLTPVAVGLAAGAAGAVGAARLLRGMLYGLDALDPTSLLAASAVILLTALASAAIPASRALRVDPAITLRLE